MIPSSQNWSLSIYCYIPLCELQTTNVVWIWWISKMQAASGTRKWTVFAYLCTHPANLKFGFWERRSCSSVIYKCGFQSTESKMKKFALLDCNYCIFSVSPDSQKNPFVSMTFISFSEKQTWTNGTGIGLNDSGKWNELKYHFKLDKNRSGTWQRT